MYRPFSCGPQLFFLFFPSYFSPFRPIQCLKSAMPFQRRRFLRIHSSVLLRPHRSYLSTRGDNSPLLGFGCFICPGSQAPCFGIYPSSTACVNVFGRSIFYFSQQISSTKLFAFPIGSRFHGKNARPSTLGEGFLIGILYTMSPFDRPLLIFRPLGVCLQKLFRSFDYCCGFW